MCRTDKTDIVNMDYWACVAVLCRGKLLYISMLYSRMKSMSRSLCVLIYLILLNQQVFKVARRFDLFALNSTAYKYIRYGFIDKSSGLIH